MNSKEVRSGFLDFFRSKGHQIVPSAPVVLKNDPTLMFVNAGMNPFKAYFLGQTKAPDPRVADAQKCLRVSGKHNDLEEVGRDTYHHTLFEMLGNWSFGDYFKAEAIAWAWELLTEVYKLPKDRLYVTVFEGSPDSDGLEADKEALDYWKQWIAQDRILMGSKKDNFWEMGDQGPCGPSSEIHIDLRPEEQRREVPGESLVNQDHPLVVEIWNLVFIQFDRKADGHLEELPEKHIDTGMGFERLCMALQGVESNYDTDLFVPLVREIEAITHTRYGKQEDTDVAIRVVADHLRAVAFAIADGQLPSNNGAGYVIRRILRRAVRYGFTFLEAKEPFIHRLVRGLVEIMGEAYPGLRDQRQLVENVIREEEQSFLKTLDQGLVMLEEVMKSAQGKTVGGEKAFELYDTFGFPIDLTSLILEENGYTLDREGFDQALQAQKDRSRSAAEVSRGDWTVLSDQSGQEFVGYDRLESIVRIVRYRQLSSKKEGDQFQLVFDQTPFYAEGGGQVGDKGYLEASNGDVIYITDTRRENDDIVHITDSLPSNPSGSFRAVVDQKQRQRTAANHTATHLLHQALREVLGNHVEQKGSAVHSKYLRFDFSHFSKLSVQELREVENFVNARIEGSLPLKEQRSVPVEEALAEGAIALFGEKYGDTVRTVRFGQSIELCGGTHVSNTSELWHFKITSEGAVAAGIRRIEAITSDAVKDFYFQNNRALFEIRDLLNRAPDPVRAVKDLQEENTALRKEIEQLKKLQAKGLKEELEAQVEDRDGIQYLAREVDLDAAGMKDLSFSMQDKFPRLFMLLASRQEGKALLACSIAKGLAAEKSLNAGLIVRQLGKHIQGGGGGQPFFATAGGKDPEGIPAALQAFEGLLAEAHS